MRDKLIGHQVHPRWVRMTSLFMLALSASCGSSSAVRAPAAGSAPAPAAAPAAARTADVAAMRAALAHVPADAFVVGAFDAGGPFLDASLGAMPFFQLEAARADALRAELDAFLRLRTGLTLAKVGALAFFCSPAGCAALLPGVDGVLLPALSAPGDETLELAVAQRGSLLVVGMPAAVAAARAANGSDALAAPLVALVAERITGSAGSVAAVDFMAIPEEEVRTTVAQFGVERGALSIMGSMLRVEAFGPEPRLRGLVRMIEGGIAMALTMLEVKKERAVEDGPFLEGASMIIAAHLAAQAEASLQLKVEGGRLLVEGALGLDSATVLPLIGALAAVAIPAFMTYLRKAKTAEAVRNVKSLYDGARTYYEDASVAGLGRAKRAFPPSARMAPPLGTCCSQPGGKCQVDASLWNNATWNMLKFSMDDPHYYSYEFISSGVGSDAAFTARAIGDLDCDSSYSTFEMVGSIDARNGSIVGWDGLFKQNELD